MKVTADTNVLVRAVVRDNEAQALEAASLLQNAEIVAVSLSSLCEFVWVLRRHYEFDRTDIALAIEALVAASNVAVDRPAVDAGLAMLLAGGDFADGVIAYEGRWIGGDTFVSFDKKAVALLISQGLNAHLLG